MLIVAHYNLATVNFQPGQAKRIIIIMKKWWWLAIGATASLVLVLALILVWYLLSHRTKPAVAAKPVLILRIDDSLSTERKATITKVMTDYMEQNGKLLRIDNQTNEPDLTIWSQSGARNEQPIEFADQPQPQQLGAGETVKSAKTPILFMSYADSALAKSLSHYDIGQLSATLQDRLKPSTQSWTLNAVGDIIIGRTVYEQEMKRNDFTSSFVKVADFLKSADLTVANNESTLADGIPYPLAGLSFAAPARAIDGHVFAGIDAVGLANNHAFNGAADAFLQMIDNFHKRGIQTFGGGANDTEARKPAIIDVKGTKVALLAYDTIPGNGRATATSAGQPFISMAPWGPFSEADVAQMETDIKAAKTQADVVLPYYHWSEEYTHQANEQMRTVAHRAIDAGATMVIGSHPHWVQGIEWYNGHLISYSLGNFVFDQEQMLKTKQGLILSATFNGSNLVSAKYTPIQIEQYFQPHLLEGAPASQVFNDVFTHSWWPIR